MWFSRARVPWQAALLVAVTCAVHAPIYGAGFLNFDDPWLIEGNPHYAPGAWRTPWVAFTDLSRETRLELGAEYLPLRDLLGWLETRAFGLWAPGMHSVSVALYVAAVLLLRAALVRTFGQRVSVELAALLFALHPVHAESVAWLSGQKDVLALLFVCAALFVHAGQRGPRRLAVPLLVLCACLSKAMASATIVLLGAQDLAQRRRPDAALYVGTCAAIGASVSLHLFVGHVVGMLAPPAGGSRHAALITMGPVWLRYLALGFAPLRTSISHDVPDRASWDAPALVGYAVTLGWFSLGVLRARRGAIRPLYAWLWFYGPLLPVSQVLAPLQNRMADRYLWLSVLAPCLVYGWAAEAALGVAVRRWQTRLTWGLTGLLVTFGFWLSFERNTLFSDSLLLFSDGTRKTRRNTDAPLQLGKALEERGDAAAASLAYREVLARAPAGAVPDARRAANSLARLLARQGRFDEAEGILRGALARFPEEPIVWNNLIKVLKAQGRSAEAAALEREAPGARARKGP